MAFRALRDWLTRSLRRWRQSVVQECPPELSACEVCGVASCSNEHWQHCHKRLAAAEYLRTGNHAALNALQELHLQEDRRKLAARRATTCAGTSDPGSGPPPAGPA